MPGHRGSCLLLAQSLRLLHGPPEELLDLGPLRVFTHGASRRDRAREDEQLGSDPGEAIATGAIVILVGIRGGMIRRVRGLRGVVSVTVETHVSG
jgi:hypothetical protein